MRDHLSGGIVKLGYLIPAVTCCVAVALAGTEERTLSADGLPPVKIGMTVKQAETVLHTKLLGENVGDPDYVGCDYVARADNREPAVSYMVEQHKITRIDVLAVDGDAPQFSTTRGIHIGSTEQSTRKAYGSSLKVESRPYQGEPDHELTVEAPDHKRAIVFETGQGRVDQIRVGVLPSVKYWEGCE